MLRKVHLFFVFFLSVFLYFSILSCLYCCSSWPGTTVVLCIHLLPLVFPITSSHQTS